MPDSLSARLLHATERLRGKRKVEAMLRQAQAMLKEAQQRQASLLAQLQQEERDVAEIEGQTLTALLFWIINQQDEKIAKERRELVAAKLRYDEAGIAVAANTECCDEYRRQIAEMAPIETEFGALLEEKSRAVMERGGDHAAALAKLDLDLSMKEGLTRELKEVIAAGESALGALLPLRAAINQAWELNNIWGGENRVHRQDQAKHAKLDRARDLARAAQERLRRFRTELADSFERLEIVLDFSDSTVFIDTYMGNLVTDWIVGSGISQALTTCSRTIDDVQKVLDDCQRRLAETTGESGQLIERRLAWILKG